MYKNFLLGSKQSIYQRGKHEECSQFNIRMGSSFFILHSYLHTYTHVCWMRICVYKMCKPKVGFNLCLWMYGNAEKLIFEILPHSIFYYSQYRQYIWADLVALALLFGLPSKILCGRISKMSFLHYPNIHKHGLMPLLSCTFCICQAPFSRRVWMKCWWWRQFLL